MPQFCVCKETAHQRFPLLHTTIHLFQWDIVKSINSHSQKGVKTEKKHICRYSLSLGWLAYSFLQLQSEPCGPGWPACDPLWAGEGPDAPGSVQHPVQHWERPGDSSRVRLTENGTANRLPLLTWQTSHYSECEHSESFLYIFIFFFNSNW